jgi:hypothetical protein
MIAHSIVQAQLTMSLLSATITSSTTAVPNQLRKLRGHLVAIPVTVPPKPEVSASLAALVGDFAHHGGELCHEPAKWRLAGTHTWTSYLYPPHLPLFDQVKGRKQNPSKLLHSKKLRTTLSKVASLPLAAAPVYPNTEHCESHHMRSINIAMNDLTVVEEASALDHLARAADETESKSSSLSSSSTSSPVAPMKRPAIALVWQVVEEEANLRRAADIYHQKAPLARRQLKGWAKR